MTLAAKRYKALLDNLEVITNFLYQLHPRLKTMREALGHEEEVEHVALALRRVEVLVKKGGERAVRVP
jgi:hypothetical protein